MKKSLLWAALILGIAWPQFGHAQTAEYRQINLNALGQNILGDAANEPTLAVDPTNPNKMAVGWRQFDTITSNFRQAGVAYTTNGGLTWTASVLQPGVFRSDPVMRSDAEGNFYFSSLSQNFSVQIFKSTTGGATWGSPIYAYGGDKQWIAIDKTGGPGHGNVYQHWSLNDSSVPNTSFTRSTNGGASYENPIFGPNPIIRYGQLAVGVDGSLYIAGQYQNFLGHGFAKSTNAQFAGQTPTFTATNINLGGETSGGYVQVNPVGLLGQVNVATANNGNIYVLSTVDPPGSDPAEVMFIRSTNGGSTWTNPIRVNKNASGENSFQWFGTMSVAPNGRIDAVWNDTSVNPNNQFSVLKYAYSLDEGNTWLGQIAFTPAYNHLLGFPQQNKIGDYWDMTSDDLGASLVFAATFTGGQDVYYMRITAVPEPSTMFLVVASGLVLSLSRRRKA